MNAARTAVKRAPDLGRHQGGIVLVLVAAGLLVMLGITGLALDGAHGMLTKTRLQNAVDAAALSAAKTLDQTNNIVEADTEARSMFAANASAAGSGEIGNAYASDAMNLTVEFSETLNPFVAGAPSGDARYVRVRASDLRLRGWFIPVMGVNEKVVNASAVAGPSPTLDQVCDVAPMMACGDPDASDEFFGYADRSLQILKYSTTGGEVGPGNFHLIRLDGGQGADDVRKAMAGDFEACVSTEEEVIETEPGNTVGPVSQGLNTRFGIYQGPVNAEDYPPDVVVEQVSPHLDYDAGTDTILYQGEPAEAADIYNYDDYLADLAAGNYDFPPDGAPAGVFERRTLAMPVGDCTETTEGQGDVPMLGVLCFHLLQEAVQKGNESHVYGQFIGEGCGKAGNPGPDPVTGPGPFIIQLYKDPDAIES